MYSSWMRATSAYCARGIVWFEVSIEPLRRPDGGAVLVWTDVTYRKQAEAKERVKSDIVARVQAFSSGGLITLRFPYLLVTATKR